MQGLFLPPDDLPDSIPKAFRAITAVAGNRIVMQIQEDQGYRKDSYEDVSEQIRDLSSSLFALGLHSGHRISIVAENSPQWVVAYLSILTIGATAVPLDIQMPKEQLLSFIRASDSQLVFASTQTWPLVQELADTVRLVKIGPATEKYQTVMTDLIAQGKKKPDVTDTVKPDDVASLLYTSGTTKKPKGVLLTHRNFMANAKSIMAKELAGPEDNFLVMLPLHHAYPFMVAFLVPLLLGAKITFLQSLKGPDLVQCLRETRITIAVAVPQVFAMIRRAIFDELGRRPPLIRKILTILLAFSGFLRTHIRWNIGRFFFAPIHRRFGSSLRLLCSGGAKLDSQIAKDLTSLGFTIREGYGLTETAPVIAFSPLIRPKPGSVGPPLKNVELHILNPNEKGIGEVVVRGPNVMKQYDNAPAETAEAIRDGWFHTGDLGYLDSDGYLFLTGRIKELIVTPGGKNILPEELEDEYQQSPAIAELCIIGRQQNGEEGEQLHAVIVANFDFIRVQKIHDAENYIKDALNRVAVTLPPYKRITGLTLVKDPLPRTRLGKIQRHLVKAQVRSQKTPHKPTYPQSDSDRELRQTDTGLLILKTLAELLPPNREIHLGDHLDLDLGFDSLKRVEFQVALERQLGNLPEMFMGEIITVRDVIEKLRGLENIHPCEAATPQSWHELFETPLSPTLTQKFLTGPSSVNLVIGKAAISLFEWLFRIAFRLTFTGIENLPKNCPYLIASNHLSFFDPFILLSVLPRSVFEQLYVLGWEPYFRSPFRMWIARVGHVIPVGPETPIISVLRASAALLRTDKSLLMFPEGERSIDGQLLPFKKGIGVLACELKVPIIPVKIEGSYQAWPPDSHMPHLLHPIKVNIGKNLTITPSMIQTWTTKGMDPHVGAAKMIQERVAFL